VTRRSPPPPARAGCWYRRSCSTPPRSRAARSRWFQLLARIADAQVAGHTRTVIQVSTRRPLAGAPSDRLSSERTGRDEDHYVFTIYLRLVLLPVSLPEELGLLEPVVITLKVDTRQATEGRNAHLGPQAWRPSHQTKCTGVCEGVQEVVGFVRALSGWKRIRRRCETPAVEALALVLRCIR
jgi:hypothetical protein